MGKRFELIGTKHPYGFSEQEKKFGEATEGITVYRVKAPVEKTAKNGYFSDLVLSI
ncbi:MAG TPA: hypothetical protein VMY59_02565 [Candidatus Thermoplasmatota archaeon]|nr:hypothetical protein [Candidatus Thermoplasmatota archaeon]